MPLKLSLNAPDLAHYVCRQMENFFPSCGVGGASGESANLLTLGEVMPLALNRLEICLDSISLRNYHDDSGDACFSHLHADQYATFLYFLANTVWKEKGESEKELCDKLMYLNRALNSIFISYKCPLPPHFCLAHPLGTILGNAEYGDFLVAAQGVTVNTGYNGGRSPKLGKGLFLGAGSAVIGNEDIGDYVSIGVGALVFRRAIPDKSVVIAKDGNLCLIQSRHGEICNAQRYFRIPF